MLRCVESICLLEAAKLFSNVTVLYCFPTSRLMTKNIASFFLQLFFVVNESSRYCVTSSELNIAITFLVLV